MAVTPQLQAQIAAIQARIEAAAADATPEDLVMLAKAVEAVGGQATVFDVLATGQEQQNQLDALAQIQQDALQQAHNQSLTGIGQAQQQAIELVQQAGQTLANVHAISLVF